MIENLRDLDAWIATNVFGNMVSFGQVVYWHQLESGEPEERPIGTVPLYTADPAAALAVLAKCAEKDIIEINKMPEGFKVRAITLGYGSGRGETLPLAICRLAQKLFEK